MSPRVKHCCSIFPMDGQAAWNIDAHSMYPLHRAHAVVDVILSLLPPVDVVHLQEVTVGGQASKSSLEREPCPTDRALVAARGVNDLDPTSSVLDVLERGLRNSYRIADPADFREYQEPNLTDITFVHKSGRVQSESVQRTRFEDSAQRRELVVLRCNIVGIGPVTLVNTQMETEKAGKVSRRKQLRQLIKLLRQDARDGRVSILAGDTSLRTNEIPENDVAVNLSEEVRERSLDRSETMESSRGRKRKLSDAFIQSQADESKRFTWDMRKNDNLRKDFGPHPPRAPYDRVLLFGPQQRHPVCSSWTLLGQKRIKGDVFPSDHWGVLAAIRVPTGPASSLKDRAPEGAGRDQPPNESTAGNESLRNARQNWRRKMRRRRNQHSGQTASETNSA